MGIGPWAVIILRLVLPPILICKNKFWGVIASAVLDASDVIITSALSLGDFTDGNYHSIDKVLDLYYLSIALFFVFGWKNVLAKKVAIGLFCWRILGVILFETTHIRPLLLVFPNLFEHFYVYFLGYIYFYKKEPFSKTQYKKLFRILLILLALKLPQEYVLHYAQAQPWVWTQRYIFKTIP